MPYKPVPMRVPHHFDIGTHVNEDMIDTKYYAMAKKLLYIRSAPCTYCGYENKTRNMLKKKQGAGIIHFCNIKCHRAWKKKKLIGFVKKKPGVRNERR